MPLRTFFPVHCQVDTRNRATIFVNLHANAGHQKFGIVHQDRVTVHDQTDLLYEDLGTGNCKDTVIHKFQVYVLDAYLETGTRNGKMVTTNVNTITGYRKLNTKDHIDMTSNREVRTQDKAISTRNRK